MFGDSSHVPPGRRRNTLQQPVSSAFRRCRLFRWGLIPSWVKDSSVAAKMINARSENGKHEACVPRCSEMSQVPDSRPRVLRVEVESGNRSSHYCFEVNEGELFAFAGIWDRCKNASGNAVESRSILTTTPNAVTAVVRDRMPVIFDLDSYHPSPDPGDEGCGFSFRTVETLQC